MIINIKTNWNASSLLLNQLTILVILNFCCSNIFSQNKYDYNWFLGYDQNQKKHELINLNFNKCPLSISYTQTAPGFSMDNSNTSMSDKFGNLMFYSSGCNILDKNGDILENGDFINPGIMQDHFCNVDGASPLSQGVIAIPKPETLYQYYLFNLDLGLPYFQMDSFLGTAPIKLYVQTIDMSFNNGNGKVINKNQVVLEDTFARGNIQASRHINGQDWWIIVPKSHSNCYFLILVTPNGIQPPIKICDGKYWGDDDYQGQTVFSPDGKKYIRITPKNGLSVFNFSNDDGKLTEIEHLDFLNDTFYAAGVAVSSNSRFLYVSLRKKLYQFDLRAKNIQDTKILIGEWDGYTDPYATIFYLCSLAPDNKIYIGGTSSHKYLHVIHAPDSLGLDCRFIQRDIKFDLFNFSSIPNFPNYRSLTTKVECDTIINSNYKLIWNNDVNIFPNPTFESVFIKLNNIYYPTYIDISNLFGISILRKKLDGPFEEIRINEFVDGIYFINLISNGKKYYSKKIVKIH